MPTPHTLDLRKTRDGDFALPRPEHRFDRAAIMRRAHQIARETRETAARQAYDLDARLIGARRVNTRPFQAYLAATPIDFGAALKTAWADAKRVAGQQSRANALVVMRPAGALAPLRRLRFARVVRLMSSVARFLNRHFIPSRHAA
ncbi:hypothetical protein SAMN06265338_14013 [Rhodoblastus acidophilus]|uniref:Uncharacterized protein n=1 Tax=Rhodoblastus acidophilus TaxID=1074 RepID=A0A212SH61_RHOAC|nr:hypothetical protein [Rhodoblastus acidophilus]PPQ34757.1 hypothetical protein CKO16_22040 [Rhodoblastus acidophilus]RAI16542.1 hypothetical protein CH337_20805 [Rhodoblastus acidophilus]SNB84864.1 hypothetical protein SAMN06265338_14013 [Rhodoblastus acidophilus]